MSLWFVFISITALGSLIYNVCMKLGSPNANAFGFALVLTASVFVSEIIACLVARYGFKVDIMQGVNMNAGKYAAIAGVAVAAIDINYFLAVRYGSVVASQVFWTVGGTIALAIFAAFFLNEPLTPLKGLGILSGIASVLLITKK